MTLLLTASNGQLGRLVVDALLAKGVPPTDLVATARNTDKIADFAARGIRTAVLDYDQPDTVGAALEGVDRVLLISGSTVGARVQGHRNVIDAARAAGVERLVYTSAPKVSTVDHPLAADHRATEEAIAASGVPAVILRNNWYTENYLANVARAAETGTISGSAGDGRVASATRGDFAEAAAAVLLGDDFTGETLELTGDVAWDFDELADAAAEVVGRPVAYERLTTEEHVAALTAAGLDAGTAAFVAGLDGAIREGVLGDATPTLAAILGRPTTPLVAGLRDALAEHRRAA